MHLLRRAPHRLLVAAALAVGSVLVVAPARAQDPARHISESVLARIDANASTALASHPGCSFLTKRRLTATALAIIYKESGSGLSAAPSPMTLSRFDVYKADGTTNQQLNYGLYAFRDPATPYQEAFWHPGVGLWQLDEAGLGVNFTASARISSDTSTDFVVDYLADQWCSPSPPANEAQGRYRAWGDWGCRQSTTSSSCQALRSLYTELYTDGGMDHLIQDSIGVLGGAEVHTCRMGDGMQLPCTYVDPARAQGDTWWRGALNGATPIADPFYVTELGGVERRTWLREDTGYVIDITAARTLGRNSRPVNSDHGLRWSSSSSLCDLTTHRGRCGDLTDAELVPPPPVSLVAHAAPSGRIPVVGDYTGDGLDDIVWYGPGSIGDELWTGLGDGAFSAQAMSVTGSEYVPFTARLGSTGRDDILWYEPHSGRVVRWAASGAAAFASTVHQVPAGTVPLVGDFDGDDRDEIHWYGKLAVPDAYWDVPADAVVATSRSVRGAYLPRVGDFDANGVDDVFWYGPGSKPDSVWMYQPGGGRAQVVITVRGTYKPAVGDLDGDGHDDVYWYAPGPAGDTIWFGIDGTRWAARSQSIKATYRLVTADLEGDGRDELVLYQPGIGNDHLWRFGGNRALASSALLTIDRTYGVAPGRFGAPGSGGLLWTSGSYAGVWYP